VTKQTQNQKHKFHQVGTTNIGTLKLGKVVHGYLIKHFFIGSIEGNVHLETSILNITYRGGSISSTKPVFDRIHVEDIVAWTTMTEGLGSNSFAFEALNYFYLMIEQLWSC